LRAVWSFWTKPFLAHRTKIWRSPEHHFQSWVLSFLTARLHYPETALYTDDLGAELLVERLGLPFTYVSTELNDLADVDEGWWAAGKLLAYSRQTVPFVHIDSDAYLWKPLPETVAQAAIFAQNPERIVLGRSCYNPVALENALHHSEGTWLPPEWEWYRRQGARQVAFCCGILGGADTDFLRHYARQALQLIQHPPNQEAFRQFNDKIGQTILIEQYLLAACVENHGRRDALQCLFRTQSDAHRREESTEKGFTHLIAGAKLDVNITSRLASRIRTDHPGFYSRSLECAAVFG
jgi:hypothetical protein